MGKAVRAQEGDWRDGFLFIGNQVALDFLNTAPVEGGHRLELLPDMAALLRWFQAAGLLSAREARSLQREWRDSAAGRRACEELRAWREQLREQVAVWESGEAVGRAMTQELNRWMALYPMRTRLSGLNGELRAELWFPTEEPRQLGAPLAYGAATLFAEADRARVRKCAQCVLHFLDTSKKGTRRWCSMQLCGNREKVAAYAARQRQQ